MSLYYLFLLLLLLFFFACSFFFLLFFFLVPNYTSLISSITGYLARLTPMVISGSQHPLKVDYSILKYYTFVVVVVGGSKKSGNNFSRLLHRTVMRTVGKSRTVASL